MMDCKRIFAQLLILVSAIAGAQNVDFAQIRNWTDEGVTVIEEDCILEGVLVSVPQNPNMGMNLQVSSGTVFNTDSRRTGYFQTRDGQSGLLIHFTKTATLKDVPRFSIVTMNLKGAELRKIGDIGYGIYRVPENSIISVVEQERSAIPVKMKRISELTPEDVYTLVRVDDLEFVFKDGAFSNVYEAHVQRTDINAACGPTQKMDNWAGLLCDSEGNSIYYLLSTRAKWRRDGKGVPQGRGWVEGIILPNTDMPRYGGRTLGKYQILPMSKEAFRMREEGAWKTLAEWNWNDNVPEIHTMDGDKKQIVYEKVTADEGEGVIFINTGGKVVRFRDMNNLRIISEKGDPNWKGIVAYGALSVQCPSCNWWSWNENRGKGLNLLVPTKDVTGSQLALCFSFAAGKCNAEGARNYPCHWIVECSSDGRDWLRVSDRIILRPLPYAPYTLEGYNYETSAECGAGYTEHLVKLPASMLGKGNIYIRIVPENKHAATLAYEGTENGSLHPDNKLTTIVNFGAVKLMYR